MSQSQQRLFVGNLPQNIESQELEELFSTYGTVAKVEVKQKKRPDDDEVVNTFAFITIDIDEWSLKRCLQDSKAEKYQNRYLQISVARENFLEKLKREREEAKTINSSKKSDESHESTSVSTKKTLPSLPKLSKQLASSSSSSSEESSDEEPAQKSTKPSTSHQQTSSKKASNSSSSDSESESESDNDDLILRKKSKAFVQNGKIKIDSGQNAPALHVIERKKTDDVHKNFTENSKKADQKRIESLKKMTDSYNQQKLAIKNALSSIDTSKKVNKIVFSDDEDDKLVQKSTSENKKLSETSSSKTNSSQKLTLFNDNDSDDDEDFGNEREKFEIRKEFEGEKGEKLWKLQTRFQNDRRFTMDSKFLDDDDEQVREQGRDNDYGHAKAAEHSAEADDMESERQWQFNILEKVIGKKLHNGNASSANEKKNANKKTPTMLRFDPNCEDHTKFVSAPKKRQAKKRAPEVKGDDGDDAKRIRTESMGNDVDEVPISMEHFYKVSDNLKNAIGGPAQFSVLSMFGRGADNDDNSTAKKNAYEEKPILKNNAKFLSDFNPFKYDSSDGEDEDGQRPKSVEKATESNKTEKKRWHETFFILTADDERLNDGIAFFTSEKNPDDVVNESKKEELRNIVKRKIKKSMQNMKSKKKTKKFSRKL